MTPTPAEDEPEYLKVEEVAARLKLKEKTIRDWILRGELPAYKLGKEWRIRRDHFDRGDASATRHGRARPNRWTLGSRRRHVAPLDHQLRNMAGAGDQRGPRRAPGDVSAADDGTRMGPRARMRRSARPCKLVPRIRSET